MHFSLAVFTEPDGCCLEDLMSRYDRALPVEKIFLRTRADVIRDYKREHTSAGLSNDELFGRILDEYGAENFDADGNLLQDVNPNGTWNSYVLGGRWDLMLRIKPGAEDSPQYETDDETGMRVANSAPVRDIDFDAMRKEAEKIIRPFANVNKSKFFSPDYLRRKYPTEEDYIAQCTCFNTPTVLLPDGTWHSIFHGSSPEAEADWQRNYRQRFLEPALQHNWTLTVVDCLAHNDDMKYRRLYSD